MNTLIVSTAAARTARLLAAVLCIGGSLYSSVAAAANLAPSISGAPATSVYVGTQYSFTPKASDPEGATLRFSIVNRPGWASFSTSTGRLYGVPSAAGLWSDIQIRVSDGVNVRALPRFSVRATAPSNRAPTISGSPSTSATVGVAYSFRPTAKDADGDSLRFSITNKPVWASFSASTGRLSGTPSGSHVGAYSSITIRVSDGRKSASLPAFSITVKRATTSNAKPVISGSPATSVVAGSAYAFQPSASDANRDPLTFRITNKPVWAGFSKSTGRLSGAPTTSHVGAYANIVIRVSDGKASAALPVFSISVTASSGNRAPTISGAPATSLTVGQAYSFRPSASDPDGDSLSFSIENRPMWAAFNTSTGQLSGTPTSAQVGAYSNIRIAVTDGRSSASLPAFGVTVSDVVNGSATLSWTPPTRNTDDTALTNLAGYRIYYGTSANSLNRTVQIANGGVATYVVSNLSPATWYFSVCAYNTAGAESARSSVASKIIR